MLKNALLGTALLSMSVTASADFYQADNSPDIYYTYGYNKICRVASPDQMKLIGGGNVQKVSANANVFSGRVDTGTCDWPNGFYRRPSGKVFLVRGANICHVSSPEQLKALGGADQLLDIGNVADIGVNKKDIGECPWP
jgi:hypothetical protein